jgi:hypothetical protein
VILIGVVLVLVVVGAVVTTPWRGLSQRERVWAVLACVVTVAMFALPVTAATSPWRRVVGIALDVCIGASVALLLYGVALARARRVAGRPAGHLVLPGMVAALPVVLVALNWALWCTAERAM